MEVNIERTSNVSWDYLGEIIPPGYLAYIKKECIGKGHVTLYTAVEDKNAASGYLLLLPSHLHSATYELAHMQVVLEDTREHIGSTLIDSVVEDLKRNKIKSLCLSYDEEDEEGALDAFFTAKGFKKDCTYCVHRFSVQQFLESKVHDVVHNKSYEASINDHFKGYAELSRIQKAGLANEKKLIINARNRDKLNFLVMNGEIVAMNGIYHMEDRIVLDDILIFDYSKLREIALFTWSYFIEYVCDTYEKADYDTVEIVVPTIEYEEASFRLIGEPISKTIRQKMILSLQEN